jgi:putative phage-type endonuclease
MPITEQQREERKNWIGASDVAAILGLNPYQSAYGLWLEKTGQLEPSKESKATKAGNRFEYGVLDEAEEILGQLARNVHVKANGLPFPLASNLDAQVVATRRPVEGKTAGLISPLNRDEWGDDGTDEVPAPYLAQGQVHVLVTDQDLCHLPAFLGGRGFCMFKIERSNEFIEIIKEKCAAFWEHVRTGNPPEQNIVPLDVARRIRRKSGVTISVPDTVVLNWLDAKEREAEAKKAKEQAEAELLVHLGQAERGETQHGIVTYLESHRKGYVVEPTTYRSLRFKGIKALAK